MSSEPIKPDSKSASSDHPLRRNRPFQAVFISQTCTDFSEQFIIVAITWAALHEFGAARLGLVLATWAIPRGGLLLFGGVLVDRWDRRRLAIGVGLALAALSLVAAAVTQSGNILAWLGVAAVLGVLDAVRLPVAAGIIPRIVGSNQIIDANRWSSLREWAALAGGPALGGVLVAVLGTGGALLLAAVLYLVSSLVMWVVPPLPKLLEEQPGRLLSDLGEGVRYVFRHPRLRILLPTFAVTNLFVLGLLGVAIPVMASNVLDAGPQGLGLLGASFGTGMVIGTLGCNRLPVSWQSSQVHIFLLFALSDVFLAAVGLAPNLVLACTAFGVSGILAGPASTYYRALLQSIPPDAYIGRVNSIGRAASFGLEPVSTALTGMATSRVSAVVVLLLGGGAAAISDVVGAVLSRGDDVPDRASDRSLEEKLTEERHA